MVRRDGGEVSDAASILRVAYEHAANNRPIAATDHLVEKIDDALVLGDFAAVVALLGSTDVSLLPCQSLTAMLMITCHAKEHLQESRALFFARVMETLRERETPQKVIDSIKRRLE
jgi:hypothetical protein